MMRRLVRLLLEGIALVTLLSLITIATRWLLLTPPADSSSPPTPTTLPSPHPSLTPSATPTPTPTATPTETPTPTQTFTPSPTPEPIAPHHATPVLIDVTVTGTPHPLPQPTPMPLVEQSEDVINIVLLGVDEGGRLTDVIIVASIDPEGPYVSLLSIPRDLYVWVPGQGFNKINTVYNRGNDYPGGKAALVKATIEYNLGIPIHYYALVNFEGFVGIVDTLGGVDMPVECELHDTFPDPNDPEQAVEVDFVPGVQHLDGYHALWYVRSRWSTHDYDRNRRQQQMLRALYRRTMAMDVIPRIPELWDALQQTVETDLALQDMLYLGWIGSQLDWTNVKSRFIKPPFVETWTAPSGAYVLLPVAGALDTMIAEAFQPPAIGRAEQPPFRVEVWDATGRPGIVDVAVERLRWEGFQVVDVRAADQAYPRTQIVDFTTTTKGSPLALLIRLYRRNGSDVIYEPTEGSPAEFRIILGADYDSCVSTYLLHYVPTPTPTPTPTP